LLSNLPGVATAEGRGEAIVLRCSDSDAAIRVLVERFPLMRDIEIAGADFEEAFLELTRAEGEEEAA
jgi:ABC-2 type transport system ATP-binding protein